MTITVTFSKKAFRITEIEFFLALPMETAVPFNIFIIMNPENLTIGTAYLQFTSRQSSHFTQCLASQYACG